MNQIALVGGQVLPVYFGIIECNPQKVVLVYNSHSLEQAQIIKRIFKEIEIQLIEVDPYNMDDINSKMGSLFNNESNCEINLTSGTKIMSLETYKLALRHNTPAFFVDPYKDELYYVTSGKRVTMKKKIGISTFLKLSGEQVEYKDVKLTDDTKGQLIIARKYYFHNSFYCFRKKYNSVKEFGNSLQLECNSNKFIYKNNNIVLELDQKKEIYNDPKLIDMLLTGEYLEYEILNALINDADFDYRLYHSVKIPYKNVRTIIKNEIDILINFGRRLAFIEIKAGKIDTKDLDKIKATRKKYGGAFATSFLVCREDELKKRIIEKCKDYNIEIYPFRVVNTLIDLSSLSDLSKMLKSIKNVEI